MIQVDKETRGFRPTVDWMETRYKELNIKLFDGALGECNFDIFTSGRGSEGRTLGRFQMKSPGLKYDRYTRRIFKYIHYEKAYADRYNFFSFCEPLISLNGNYSGTEYGFLATLAHEMCHYYTYRNGFVPSRGHGSEFYSIGNMVSVNSDGLFTIQRLASAEDMSHLDLDDEMKSRKEKRLATKKSNIYAFFDYRSDNDIRLVTTNNEKLMNAICDFNRYNKLSKQVIITNDSNVIDLLFEKGYKKNFRTWRYWQVAGQDWLSILDNADKEVKKNPNIMNENKQRRDINNIISETINNFIREKMGEDVAFITPDMDLGAYSPLEIE